MVAVTSLHLDTFGDGVPAVFVHGSFGWGVDTFPEQRSLADEWRIILVDRRGFGGSRFSAAEGWPADMHDVAGLLNELGPAHLVGQSYGAVVALLAAGLAPEAVLSLTVIEPPAFEMALGDADADAMVAALKPVFERAGSLTAAEFTQSWARANGMPDERLAAWTAAFGEDDWVAAEATRHERWPGDASIDVDALRAAPFPKVVARGGWPAAVAGRDGGGRAFAAVCRVIAEGIGARVVVFERSTHNPQLQEPDAFNRLLRDVWGSVAPR